MHELEMIDGKAQMAYTGEVPWHNLGTRVDDTISPREIQAAAGLDFLAMAGFTSAQAIKALPGVVNLATVAGVFGETTLNSDIQIITGVPIHPGAKKFYEEQGVKINPLPK